MESAHTYEKFPFSIVFLSNLLTLSIYAVGAYILAGFSILVAILYLVYGIWIEIGVLRGSCRFCYYYGKVCGFGKGKLCSLLFKNGDSQKFATREISWLQLLPDFMVVVFPIVGGIILLFTKFNWPLAIISGLFLILWFGGTAFIRGSFTCKYCKQKELGCPAQQLFGNETRNNT